MQNAALNHARFRAAMHPTWLMADCRLRSEKANQLENGEQKMKNSKSEENILEVKDLQIHFFTDRGVIRAVEGVDFSVRKQEVWGLVGESASGKSVIGQALVGVVAKPAGRVVSGEIFFKGEDILKNESQRG